MTIFFVCLLLAALAGGVLGYWIAPQRRHRRFTVIGVVLASWFTTFVTALWWPEVLIGIGIRLATVLIALAIPGLLVVWILSHFRRSRPVR